MIARLYTKTIFSLIRKYQIVFQHVGYLFYFYKQWKGGLLFCFGIVFLFISEGKKCGKVIEDSFSYVSFWIWGEDFCLFYKTKYLRKIGTSCFGIGVFEFS